MIDPDPFTYEILRHRLWTVNVEGALALQQVTGSPLATEAFDMNTSIMTAGGEVTFVGPYLLTGPMSQGIITRKILVEYAENPGISPGDMFVCNDPYSGAAHQNCVTLVAPIHYEGRLVAWCGATLHVVDVGGSRSGQVGIGANSILEEAPVIPPLKIVARDRLLRDVEANYLARSRTRELNALDLRGKIAALNTIRHRVLELVEAHGPEAVQATLATTIDRGVEHLRARLAELPDASFHHTAYVDRSDEKGGGFYAVRLWLDKEGDHIRLDFTDSSSQASAVINCTRSALESGVLIAVLTCLVYDAPWCPAAVERVVEVISRPGTVVDARWPAGCSMATMAAGFAVTTATAACLGRLLAASDEHRDQAMAGWAGAVGSVDVFGTDASGRPFGTVLLDSMISGAGARAAADGIDGGGFLRSMACAVANVEHYEARFPIMYLFRRLEPDTGGAGRMRGGVGAAYAVIPHPPGRIDRLIPHFSGVQQPESMGLAGGHPGAPNRAFLLSGARVAAEFAAGRVPTTPEMLGGKVHSLPGITEVPISEDDVFAVVATGGGGWGDPLERDPDRVAADVASHLVTPRAAADVYGVVLDAAGSPDAERTHRRRSDIRRRRAAAPAAQGTAESVDPGRWLGPVHSGPVDDVLETERQAGARLLRCRRCGHAREVGGDYEASLPSRRQRVDQGSPPATGGSAAERVERYCPSCWTLVSTDRTVTEDVVGGHGPSSG